MKATVSEESAIRRQATVSIGADAAARELAKAYKAIAKRVKMPGFRPGKVPQHVLEKEFKRDAENTAQRELIGAAIRDVVREHKLEPVGPPMVTVTKPISAAGMDFTLVFEIRPEVKIGNYKGITAGRYRIVVHDTEVDDELWHLCDHHAQLVPITSRDTAHKGDYVTVDYSLYGKGGSAPLGHVKEKTLRLGAGGFAEGFETGIEGMKLGEEKVIDVTLPRDFKRPELAGKPAHIKTRLTAISQRVKPLANDDFAKDLDIPGVDSLATLKADITRRLEARKKREADAFMLEKIIEKIAADNPFPVPEALVNQQTEFYFREIARRVGIQDIKELPIDTEKLRGEYRSRAVFLVQKALIMDEIARAEKIEITANDVMAKLTEIATASGEPVAKVAAYYERAQLTQDLALNIRDERAKAVLLAHAVPQEIEPPPPQVHDHGSDDGHHAHLPHDHDDPLHTHDHDPADEPVHVHGETREHHEV